MSKASLISAYIAFPPDGTQQQSSKTRTTMHRVMNTRCAWRADQSLQPPTACRSDGPKHRIRTPVPPLPLNFEGGSKLRLHSSGKFAFVLQKPACPVFSACTPFGVFEKPIFPRRINRLALDGDPQHPPRPIRTTTSRNRLFAYPTCRPIPSIGSAATKPGFGARPVRSCLRCSAWIDEIHGKGRDCVEVIPRTGYSKVLEK